MTESVWLSCGDPKRLLKLLWMMGRVSDRKFRLFAAACCRVLWDRLADERSRRAVGAAELYADGLITKGEHVAAGAAAEAAEEEICQSARAAATRATEYCPWFGELPATSNSNTLAPVFSGLFAAVAAKNAAIGDPVMAATETASEASKAVTRADVEATRDATKTAAQQYQVHLLRDITGNPFRPAQVDASWLAWNNGTVAKLAQATYEERNLPKGTLDPARLAVLADALEEAGCTDADILSHLRGPGPHVRGCWPVDLLLGKE